MFPITLPPLRERGDDVVLLAAELARVLARRMGRRIEPLAPEMAARLRGYSWPGNVRELQNVVERAVITSKDGHLNLERAMPGAASPAPEAEGAVLTAEDLVRIERDNIRRALERCGGKVAGEAGAARLLGMAPSTLSSRMKALGLARS